MPDAIFDDRRLAAIYDSVDADRSDLDAYVALADELGARSVLDIGCGTGTFACLLAQRGKDVTGVDPATASLDVLAKTSRPGVDHWGCHEASPASSGSGDHDRQCCPGLSGR
jgi:2-polyprenyl-3-methyl-5-hydroxy-6-metoxy-1,4-benzoquinol methylase